MDMCRFGNASDPNYRKVLGELKIISRSLEIIARLNRLVGGVSNPCAISMAEQTILNNL
jgi:hypothetical protein